MAIGMKSWLGIVAIGMTWVALANLPPDYQGPDAHRVSPERARLLELNREARVASGILSRRALSDSLAPVTAAAGVGGVVFDGPAEAPRGDGSMVPFLTDSLRAVIEEALARDLARWPHARRAALGVFASPRTSSRSLGHETFAGTLDGTPYCFRVIASSPRFWTEGVRLATQEGQDALGPCRFYAHHGAPGPDIERWLKDGGADFAAAPADVLFRSWAGLPAPAIVGLRNGAPSLEPDRCLSGVVASCAATFLGAIQVDADVAAGRRIAAASPVVSVGGTVMNSAFGPLDDFVLADLEAEFGPERFSAFWTSDDDVRVAFRRAFDTDPGEWMFAWTRANIGGSERPGPGLPRSASTGALALMVLSGLVATLAAKRRRLA